MIKELASMSMMSHRRVPPSSHRGRINLSLVTHSASMDYLLIVEVNSEIFKCAKGSAQVSKSKISLISVEHS